MTSLLPNLCIKLSSAFQILVFHCFSNINNNSEVYLGNVAVHCVYGRHKSKCGMFDESCTTVHEADGRRLCKGHSQAVIWMKHAIPCCQQLRKV